jgi:hypothetical protein
VLFIHYCQSCVILVFYKGDYRSVPPIELPGTIKLPRTSRYLVRGGCKFVIFVNMLSRDSYGRSSFVCSVCNEASPCSGESPCGCEKCI